MATQKPEPKENEVVGVNPDGTVFYFDLEVCAEHARLVLEDLYEKEGTVPNFNFVAAIHALFMESAIILEAAGWETTQLVDDMYNCIEDSYQYEFDYDEDPDESDDSED